ncbi:hypothetical protein KAR91_20135 [Candidatus Pacearchaeota archaeon]|nr:hypothetical protein [Candidatus Pacearchaeota archaeon]
MSELSTPRKHHVNFIDLTDQQFGKWEVLEYAGKSKDGRVLWLCRCECGEESKVIGTSLRNSHSTQCRKCHSRIASVVHGHTKNGISRTYRSWACMRARCNNPKAINFKYYGGRGITICDRWRNSFKDFLADMGERPAGMTIDRRDPDGNYEPSNCRWSTQSIQSKNRSRVK